MGRSSFVSETFGLKNLEVARVLNRIADLLELTNENPFKVRAYRRAAETLTGLTEDVAALAERGTLTDVPGVGKDLATRIRDICATGTCETHETLHKEIPAGLLALTSLDGMGPKTARLLWKVLGVYSKPPPAEPPPRYPLWPLWYVSWSFLVTRRAGGLFVLGLLLDAIYPLHLV